MIEKYLSSKNSNRWIDNVSNFIQNYNSSYHSSIRRIPERLEIFDEVELIRNNIANNDRIKSTKTYKRKRELEGAEQDRRRSRRPKRKKLNNSVPLLLTFQNISNFPSFFPVKK